MVKAAPHVALQQPKVPIVHGAPVAKAAPDGALQQQLALPIVDGAPVAKAVPDGSVASFWKKKNAFGTLNLGTQFCNSFSF